MVLDPDADRVTPLRMIPVSPTAEEIAEAIARIERRAEAGAGGRS